MEEVECQAIMTICGQIKEINQEGERDSGGAGRRKDAVHMRASRDIKENNGEGRLQVRRSRQSRGRWQRRCKEHRWRYKGECRNNVPKEYAAGKVRTGDKTKRGNGYGDGGAVQL